MLEIMYREEKNCDFCAIFIYAGHS